MSRLEKFVTDVSTEIKERVPEAQISISYELLEDTDAIIHVHPPTDEAEELLSEFAAARTFDVLMEEGYNIAVLVHEPDRAWLSDAQRQAQ
jgi:hypothetical protein